MGVPYIVIPKMNPQDRKASPKFYAHAKSRSELTFRQLSKEIADGSTTVSDTDVMAVLKDLTKILKRHLANGEIVRFGDFGTFQIGLSSEGAETEAKFNASLITSSKVNFRPGTDLKEMPATLKYEKQSKHFQ